MGPLTDLSRRAQPYARTLSLAPSSWRHQPADWLQPFDMVGNGFDDNEHRHGENRAPRALDPSPQQQTQKHRQRIHPLGLSHQRGRQQPSFE